MKIEFEIGWATVHAVALLLLLLCSYAEHEIKIKNERADEVKFLTSGVKIEFDDDETKAAIELSKTLRKLIVKMLELTSNMCAFGDSVCKIDFGDGDEFDFHEIYAFDELLCCLGNKSICQINVYE